MNKRPFAHTSFDKKRVCFFAEFGICTKIPSVLCGADGIFERKLYRLDIYSEMISRTLS